MSKKQNGIDLLKDAVHYYAEGDKSMFLHTVEQLYEDGSLIDACKAIDKDFSIVTKALAAAKL